jgi:UDP-glucose 4-epimerase
MHVLITGSSGQIGTNLALALFERGDTVEGVDVRPNTWTDRIPTHIADLTESTSLGGEAASVKLEASPDIVVHLAAHAKVFELVEHPRRALANIEMAFSALEFARERGLPLIFGSSREVYGDIQHHLVDENHADFVVAESPYSASKISCEALIYSYCRCYDLPFHVFRFSNVYGRYDCDIERMERVIPLFIRRIAADQPIVVYGPEKVLDFTFVDDCIDGIVRGIDALTSGRVANQTFNLAFGQGVSLIDLVNIIGLALGKDPKVTCEATRSGEITRYVADISKARAHLGYEPRVRFTSGLPRAIAWQREAGFLKG